MLKNKKFKGKESNQLSLMLCLGLERTLNWYKNDVDWFISVLGVALGCYMVVWIAVEEFLYK